MAREAGDNLVLVITYPFGPKKEGPSFALDHNFVARTDYTFKRSGYGISN